MTFQSRFVAPFRYRKLPEAEGVEPNAIFFLARRPFEQTAVQVSDDQGFTYISRYEYCLWGDLWLFKFAFGWRGRHRNPPRETTK